MTNVRTVASRQASDTALNTWALTYSSQTYGNPCRSHQDSGTTLQQWWVQLMLHHCEIRPRSGQDFFLYFLSCGFGHTWRRRHSKLQPAATKISNAVRSARFLDRKEWQSVNLRQRFISLCLSIKVPYESTDYPSTRYVQFLWCLKCVKYVFRRGSTPDTAKASSTLATIVAEIGNKLLPFPATIVDGVDEA